MRAVLLLTLLLGPACSDRRDFEERYDDTANTIAARANAIDHELNETEPQAPPRR